MVKAMKGISDKRREVCCTRKGVNCTVLPHRIHRSVKTVAAVSIQHGLRAYVTIDGLLLRLYEYKREYVG